MIADRSVITEKIKESAVSVLPIVVIVMIMCLTITPIEPDLLLCFLIGALLLTFGMGLFSLGAELSMTPIGSKIGTTLTKTKKLPLILIVALVLGFAITISEPDLQVLAETVPHIDGMVLIVTVGVGVGIFLAVCMLRILFGIKLKWFLLIFYAVVFAIAAFSDDDFLGIAFDSGGVTTGPMTVPFILAFGLGVANIRSDTNAEADSFGLVALCSVGPILSILVLGLFYPNAGGSVDISAATFSDTVSIGFAYLSGIPSYMKEMGIAILPIVAVFFLFQAVSFRMSKRALAKVCFGFAYTYVGLVFFLTGVNVGFSPLGAVIGDRIAADGKSWLLVALAMLMGWFIISAEPAVKVLEKQIEDVSAGVISGKAIKLSLSIGISLAMGLSMLRVITGISILWFIVPGYALALALTFFVPDIYTAVAFDSGGVASGPMTATFMLQFFIGASTELGGNVLADAFGVVAMVAMMPLITIQVVGLYSEYRYKTRLKEAPAFADDDIIELWEAAAR